VPVLLSFRPFFLSFSLVGAGVLLEGAYICRSLPATPSIHLLPQRRSRFTKFFPSQNPFLLQTRRTGAYDRDCFWVMAHPSRHFVWRRQLVNVSPPVAFLLSLVPRSTSPAHSPTIPSLCSLLEICPDAFRESIAPFHPPYPNPRPC